MASANVVGLGLIGGSIALALKSRGCTVSGFDEDARRLADALERGIVDSDTVDPDAEVTFVCVPVEQIPIVSERMVVETKGIVTDVGSVKQGVADRVRHPRFVGGHPMAGSEMDGLDGADADLFEGAVWVLTPTAETADDTFTRVAGMVKDLGADVVAMAPDRHDDLVAVVSHAPHLVAASLMSVADRRASDDTHLLRLAAGGFRDMTRIAAGNPRIWLDICRQNRDAILAVLGELVVRIEQLSSVVSDGDLAALERMLDEARSARINLPAGLSSDEGLHEVRIPIPDRPGAAAEVFTLAGEVGVNIHDFEVAHSPEGSRGVVILLVASSQVDILRGGLLARGFKPGVQALQ